MEAEESQPEQIKVVNYGRQKNKNIIFLLNSFSVAISGSVRDDEREKFMNFKEQRFSRSHARTAN